MINVPLWVLRLLWVKALATAYLVVFQPHQAVQKTFNVDPLLVSSNVYVLVKYFGAAYVWFLSALVVLTEFGTPKARKLIMALGILLMCYECVALPETLPDNKPLGPPANLQVGSFQLSAIIAWKTFLITLFSLALLIGEPVETQGKRDAPNIKSSLLKKNVPQWILRLLCIQASTTACLVLFQPHNAVQQTFNVDPSLVSSNVYVLVKYFGAAYIWFLSCLVVITEFGTPKARKLIMVLGMLLMFYECVALPETLPDDKPLGPPVTLRVGSFQLSAKIAWEFFLITVFGVGVVVGEKAETQEKQD